MILLRKGGELPQYLCGVSWRNVSASGLFGGFFRLRPLIGGQHLLPHAGGLQKLASVFQIVARESGSHDSDCRTASDSDLFHYAWQRPGIVSRSPQLTTGTLSVQTPFH